MPRSLTRLASEPFERSPFFLPTLEHQAFPGGRGSWTNLVIPLWIPLVMFASFPCLAFIRGPLRRYRRRRRGLCVTCGYDLRGSPDRCPECGKDTNGIAK